jgi:alkanesulfonate monooxygenase SsuD/methylene tetrahydromethanopterin reductase-like flavin-dependent oxidoreductase (luciferase family)
MSDPFSIGISLSSIPVVVDRASARDVLEWARLADGYETLDSLWLGDSLLVRPRPSVTMTLAALAGVTERVRLGTACLSSFTLRHPVSFAYEWASPDQLSGGRTQLTLCLGGIGPREQVDREFTTMGATLKERVPRMLEGIRILRRLWSEDDVTFEGRFHSFEGVTVEPKPVQAPCPIWIANNPPTATADRAYRRVVEHADGWMTGSLPGPHFQARWEEIRALRVAARGTADGFASALHIRGNVGDQKDTAIADAARFVARYYGNTPSRDHLEKQCIVGTPEECAEGLVELHHSGCRHIVVGMASLDQEEQIKRWATQVVPEARARIESVGAAAGSTGQAEPRHRLSMTDRPEVKG